MGTLNGALKLGQLKIDEFVDADGPSALLDVVAETTCKPKLSWLDVEVPSKTGQTRPHNTHPSHDNRPSRLSPAAPLLSSRRHRQRDARPTVRSVRQINFS